MNQSQAIVLISNLPPGKDEGAWLSKYFSYLGNALPNARMVAYGKDGGGPINGILQVAKGENLPPAERYFFIPMTSIHIPALVLEIASAKLDETESIYFDGTKSYPAYIFNLKDRFFACRGSRAGDSEAAAAIAEALWRYEIPEHAKILRADMDCVYASYYRYIDTNPLPVNVQIEPSSYCNFRCGMCPYHGHLQSHMPGYLENQERHSLDIKVYERVIDELHSLSPEHMTIIPQLRGEPLAHEHLLDMVRIAKRYPENAVSFSTNGALLSESMGRSLISAGVDELVVSMHVNRIETARRLDMEAKFHTVRENIRNFIKIKKEIAASNPRLYIKFVEMDENRAELNEFLDTWLSEDVAVGVGKKDYYNIDTKNTNYYSFFALPGFDASVRSPCFISAWTVTILSNGDVVRCYGTADKSIILGNVHEQSIVDIINSPARKTFLANCNNRLELEPVCRGCQTWTSHVKVEGEMFGRHWSGAACLVYTYA